MEIKQIEEYYKINVLGEFGDYSSGLVVKGFSDSNLKHLKYVPNLPLHITCDFNVDPMCWVLAYIDKDNEIDSEPYEYDSMILNECQNDTFLGPVQPNPHAKIIEEVRKEIDEQNLRLIREAKDSEQNEKR